ncbi:hypothetical protein MKP08_04855 [Erythrobacter sp. LQ02-29]|uniref:hypothetical protein n=1 Tax=Erythrobacter sp. LQ02-29 TaxID=2920384 RepID=UPI001F4EF31A|nr:hypothetical protein [Erythrobacter sp. LQ02-29]MCP9222075.1 hypothetical protein [Erythrobacter sp. LQ02-29]
MRFVRLIPAIVMLGVLSGCGSDAEPEGQVAATMDGQEITQTQVNAEMSGFGDIDPSQRQAAANQALDQILGRVALADEARERGLDKTPAGAIELQKAQDIALINMLRQDIRSKVPKPSAEEAQQFVADNPGMFQNRFVTIVEQLVVPQISPDLVKKMEPIDDLPGIEALLNANGVTYRTTMGAVDSITLAPEVVKAISGMGVGAVYIMPQGNGVRINAIRSRQTIPITGADATKLASEMVFEQRVNGQTMNAFGKIVEGRKGNVKYAKEFQPPKTKQGAAPGATPAPSTASTPGAGGSTTP